MLKLSFLKNFNFDPRLDPEVEFLDRKLQAEIDLATHHVTQEGFFFFNWFFKPHAVGAFIVSKFLVF